MANNVPVGRVRALAAIEADQVQVDALKAQVDARQTQINIDRVTVRAFYDHRSEMRCGSLLFDEIRSVEPNNDEFVRLFEDEIAASFRKVFYYCQLRNNMQPRGVLNAVDAAKKANIQGVIDGYMATREMSFNSLVKANQFVLKEIMRRRYFISRIPKSQLGNA